MSNGIRALVFAWAISATGLAPAGRLQAQMADPGSITVQNNRNVKVTVMVEQGNFDIRLGTVPSLQTATLPIPPWLLRDGSKLQFFVHPEGEIDLSAETFDVHPGVHLGLIVPEKGFHWVERARPSDSDMSPEEPTMTTVRVENLRAVDVTVYVEQDPFDVRLGVVRPNETRTFRLPDWLVRDQNDADFLLHPEHGVDLTSETMALHKGAHLAIQVPVK